MHRAWLLVLGLLLTSAPDFSQSTPSDSQSLQALVAEVRQLRKDLQTTNASAVRTQILLYRLQAQEATVAHLSQLLTDARSKLAETQDHRRHVVAVVKLNEEAIENTEISPASRKEAQQTISRMKPELESLAAEEQQRQAAEMEAEEQLRTEQANLSGLQDRADRLEKDLGRNLQ